MSLLIYVIWHAGLGNDMGWKFPAETKHSGQRHVLSSHGHPLSR